VILGIGNVHRVIHDTQRRRPVDFTVTGALGAPLAEVVPIFVKDRDPVEPIVGDIHLAIAIQGNRGGPGELPIACARRAEFTDKILAERTNRNADPIRPIFIGPIYDIDQLIIAKGEVHRIAETRTAELITTHRVAVGERPVCEPKKMCCHNASTPLYRITGSPPRFLHVATNPLLGLSDLQLIEKPISQSYH
jgi:hypothetical protein